MSPGMHLKKFQFKYHNTVTRCVQFESVRGCVVFSSCPAGRHFPETSRASHTVLIIDKPFKGAPFLAGFPGTLI